MVILANSLCWFIDVHWWFFEIQGRNIGHAICGGSINGGTPIARWFICRKLHHLHLSMDDWGYPHDSGNLHMFMPFSSDRMMKNMRNFMGFSGMGFEWDLTRWGIELLNFLNHEPWTWLYLKVGFTRKIIYKFAMEKNSFNYENYAGI